MRSQAVRHDSSFVIFHSGKHEFICFPTWDLKTGLRTSLQLTVGSIHARVGKSMVEALPVRHIWKGQVYDRLLKS